MTPTPSQRESAEEMISNSVNMLLKNGIMTKTQAEAYAQDMRRHYGLVNYDGTRK